PRSALSLGRNRASRVRDEFQRGIMQRAPLLGIDRVMADRRSRPSTNRAEDVTDDAATGSAQCWPAVCEARADGAQAGVRASHLLSVSCIRPPPSRLTTKISP